MADDEEDQDELESLMKQKEALKKKKENKTEIHQSVNISIDDSVINRSSIGNIGGGEGNVNIDKEVGNKEISPELGKFCTSCGSRLPTTYKANFCPQCGAEVQR